MVTIVFAFSRHWKVICISIFQKIKKGLAFHFGSDLA